MIRSEKFKEQLLKEYLMGASQKELSKKYNTDALYQLKKLGIKRRGTGEQRIITRGGCFKLNWNCETVSNEQEAYILGMLFADGHVCGSQLGLKLKFSDGELVNKIKNYFSEEIKLQKEKNNHYYGFVVSSTTVVKNLSNFGLISRKSIIDFRMPNIPKNLYRHFIRGYFDGDGSIYKCVVRGKPAYLKGYICSPNISILKDFKAILLENGIDCQIDTEKRKGKSMKCFDYYIVSSTDMYRLFIRKKEALLKFYHFLYDDCIIYLDRKKKIFDDNFDMLKYIHVNTEVN